MFTAVQETPSLRARKKTQETQNLYILTSTTKVFDGIGRRIVYGIEVKSCCFKEGVEDISSDQDLVLSLLNKLAKEQCSPLHLKDVVEDFLIDPNI